MTKPWNHDKIYISDFSCLFAEGHRQEERRPKQRKKTLQNNQSINCACLAAFDVTGPSRGCSGAVASVHRLLVIVVVVVVLLVSYDGLGGRGEAEQRRQRQHDDEGKASCIEGRATRDQGADAEKLRTPVLFAEVAPARSTDIVSSSPRECVCAC